ncbi:hypothetical protein ALI144C_27530 [Actinosynnema sp. ALI-1.44]|nr:hypothetical protein ALI144C_27530 [Actinosynnema sp. ALI-1.44]
MPWAPRPPPAPACPRRSSRSSRRPRVAVQHEQTWQADAVISATGTWWRSFIPAIRGRDGFTGRQLHTVDYRDPDEFRGQRVVVGGGGNSGAQIAADLTEVADLTWVTRRPPRYLPDNIDGRALFDIATRRRDDGGIASLGDIVAVPPVRSARGAGLLNARPGFDHLEQIGPVWTNGGEPASVITPPDGGPTATRSSCCTPAAYQPCSPTTTHSKNTSTPNHDARLRAASRPPRGPSPTRG